MANQPWPKVEDYQPGGKNYVNTRGGFAYPTNEKTKQVEIQRHNQARYNEAVRQASENYRPSLLQFLFGSKGNPEDFANGKRK